jgi:hypothetical protein
MSSSICAAITKSHQLNDLFKNYFSTRYMGGPHSKFGRMKRIRNRFRRGTAMRALGLGFFQEISCWE